MERTYIIPLRKEWLKVPKYLRSRKAVKATRSFLQKHMKTEDVKLGKHLNLKLWERGNRNPPHKVEVVAKKIEDKEKGTYTFAELAGAPIEEKKEVKKKGLAARLKEKITDGSKKEKAAEKKEETPQEVDKKPIGALTPKETAQEEERLLEKESKTAPKKKAPAKKPAMEEPTSSKDIRATLNRSDMKR